MFIDEGVFNVPGEQAALAYTWVSDDDNFELHIAVLFPPCFFLGFGGRFRASLIHDTITT